MFCFPKLHLSLKADKKVSVDLGPCPGVCERYRGKDRGKDGRMQEKEDKQNKDMRYEHCALFTMSFQKKKKRE